MAMAGKKVAFLSVKLQEVNEFTLTHRVQVLVHSQEDNHVSKRYYGLKNSHQITRFMAF